MRVQRTTASAFAAAAATLLVACGQGPDPEELATDACRELPTGVPQQQVEDRITSLAEEQGVDLAEEDLQQALREVQDRCPEVLEGNQEDQDAQEDLDVQEDQDVQEDEGEQEAQDDQDAQEDQDGQDGQDGQDDQEDEGEE